MNNNFRSFINASFEDDDKMTPARILYFAIIDKTPPKNETNEELNKQILCYISKDDKSNLDLKSQEDIKLRQIGLIQGIMNFSYEFSKENLQYIDTENTRTLICGVENNQFYLVMCFQLTKFIINNISEYNCFNIAPPELLNRELLNIYDMFVLNNGSLKQNINTENQNKVINEWFENQIYGNNSKSDSFKLNIQYKGFLSLLNKYKVSRKKTILQKNHNNQDSSNNKKLNFINNRLSDFFQLHSSNLLDMFIFANPNGLLTNTNNISNHPITLANNSVNTCQVNTEASEMEIEDYNSNIFGRDLRNGINKMIPTNPFNYLSSGTHKKLPNTNMPTANRKIKANIVNESVEDYGIVFSGYGIISYKSFLSIYNWIEDSLINIKVPGRNKNKNVDINNDNLNCEDEVNGDGESDVIFNPFLSTFQKINHSLLNNPVNNNILNILNKISNPVINPISHYTSNNNSLDIDSSTNTRRNNADQTQNDHDYTQIENLNKYLKNLTTKKTRYKGNYLIGLKNKDNFEDDSATSNDTPQRDIIELSPNPNYILNSPLLRNDITYKKLFIKIGKERTLDDSGLDVFNYDEDDEDDEDYNLTECNIVIYCLGDLCFALLYNHTYNDLSNIEFYYNLEESLIDLHDCINDYFVQQSERISLDNKSKSNIENNGSKTLFQLPSIPFLTSSIAEDPNCKYKTKGNEESENQDALTDEFYYILIHKDDQSYQTSIPILSEVADDYNGNSADSDDDNERDYDQYYDYSASSSRKHNVLKESTTSLIYVHSQLTLNFASLVTERGEVEEKLINTDKNWCMFFKDFPNLQVILLKKLQFNNTNLLFNENSKFKNNGSKNYSSDFLNIFGNNARSWMEKHCN